MVAETQSAPHNISFKETANSTGFQIEQTIIEAREFASHVLRQAIYEFNFY